MKLCVDLGIGRDQLEAPVKQAIEDPVHARPDCVLDVVGPFLAEDVFANLGGIAHQFGCHSRVHSGLMRHPIANRNRVSAPQPRILLRLSGTCRIISGMSQRLAA